VIAPLNYEDVPITGHAPIPANIAEQVTAQVSKKIVGWGAGIIAVGVVALVGSTIVFYSTVHADQARAEEVHSTLRRDVTALEVFQRGQVERHTLLVTQVATLTTKIDTQTTTLVRIQRLLDERLPPRPTRRRGR
jgi:hypothetical protein